MMSGADRRVSIRTTSATSPTKAQATAGSARSDAACVEPLRPIAWFHGWSAGAGWATLRDDLSIGCGESSKEIGAALEISHRTVENHRSNICQKLGLAGPHALLRFALQRKADPR